MYEYNMLFLGFCIPDLKLVSVHDMKFIDYNTCVIPLDVCTSKTVFQNKIRDGQIVFTWLLFKHVNTSTKRPINFTLWSWFYSKNDHM